LKETIINMFMIKEGQNEGTDGLSREMKLYFKKPNGNFRTEKHNKHYEKVLLPHSSPGKCKMKTQ
jgi:hypothetical protein